MIAPCDCPTDIHQREQKEHGTFPFPVACYLGTFRTLPTPWHWHDELEVNYLRQGSAVLHIGSAAYRLTKGSGCFINAGVLHAVEKTDDTSVIEDCIVFHPRFIGGSMDSIFWQKYVLPVTSDRLLPGVPLDPAVPWQKEMLSCIRTAWEACAKENGHYEITARNMLSRCMGLLLDNRPAQEKNIPAKSLRQSDRMKTMLSFIQQHFDEPLTIRQIASSASVSESECMRCFRQTIGMAPITYLKSYRLQHAAALLKDTDFPVTSVGSLCGFQEMSYFSRSFRQIYGCTPSGYRKAVKQT